MQLSSDEAVSSLSHNAGCVGVRILRRVKLSMSG
jgi:hypothetical protein